MDSKTVFDLRNEAKGLSGFDKLNKLLKALDIAQKLFFGEPYDEWVQKAYGWILIDLIKHYISVSDLTQAAKLFNQLISINFNYKDDIIENQKVFLQPKIDVFFRDVKRAEELSKSGNHEDAINAIKSLIFANRFSELHHESYGWIIYRLVKDRENQFTSIQVRSYLKDYINLKNERPSLLHSMILNFALQYSKEHKDFNLYHFFKLWNPKNLRDEDKTAQHYNDKKLPSLVSRVLREFVDNDLDYEIEYLIENIEMPYLSHYSDLPF